VARQADYANCLRPCLLAVPDLSVTVLSVIPPPELHLFIGCTNHLFNMVKTLMIHCHRLPQFLAWCSRNSITMRGDAVQCSAVQCSAVHCCAVHCWAMGSCVVCCSALQCSSIRQAMKLTSWTGTIAGSFSTAWRSS
jgi:hypothetical protein